jgi:Uma2 family endonuclease
MATASTVLPVVSPADDVPGPPQGKWTYTSYARLPADGNRYQIIDGVLFTSPTPTTVHQAASGLFITHLTIHVQFAGLGRVLGAPCDVELAPDVVVQPDVVVVLKDHLGIIKRSHVVGSPDLVVEIASPGTAGYDRRQKQDAYAAARVPEYWIADPAAQTIEVLVLGDDTYHSLGVFRGEATLPSTVLPSLPVQVQQFFA